MYITVSIFMTFYIPVIYIARAIDFYEVRSVADSLVIVANFAILVFLKYKLSKFSANDMSTTVCSIYTQFFLFLISYIFICIIDFYFGFTNA